MKRWNFDYVRPKAEGIGVHAPDFETAYQKALDLANKGITNRRDLVTKLVFRDNAPCVSQCEICGVK